MDWASKNGDILTDFHESPRRDRGPEIYSDLEVRSDFDPLDRWWNQPRLNRWRAIDDLVDLIEQAPKSRMPDLISGAFAALSCTQPGLLDAVRDRLRVSPLCADTADIALESLQFLNSHERYER